MNKYFMSVSTKFLLLIIMILLIISVIFSSVSLSRIKAEFTYFKHQVIKNGQEHWQVHNTLLSNQLLTWIESFSDLFLKNDHKKFIDMSQTLKEKFDTLQLHLNIDNLWFIDQHKQLLFSSSKLPNIIQQKMLKVRKQQDPISEVFCQRVCHQLVIVPILNNKGELAVIAVTASLTNVLYSMKKTLKNEVAIIYIKQKNGLPRVNNQLNIISVSNSKLLPTIFKSIEHPFNINIAQKNGLQLPLKNKFYLINLLPLYKNKVITYYLVLVDDVSRFSNEMNSYRQQFLLSIFVVFAVLGVLIYSISSLFTKRILILASALPLLAKKQFKQFQSIKLKHRQIFPDEFDILATSALTLSYELEQLNQEVDQKTNELENIAMYDLLTGLPNRNMLNYQLQKTILGMETTEKNIAIILLNLDDFKKVNASYGHDEGDRLLIEAAHRIGKYVRKIDLVCRIGSDEFVILLDQLGSLDQVILMVDNLLKQFAQPLKIDSHIFYVSASIGIAYTNDVSLNAENLIRQADIALHEAKSKGGNKYFIYQNAMYLKVAKKVNLETEVRQALKKQQFSLSLQPQILTSDHQLSGFEALLRWRHPERGMISPEEFIPILENSDYMLELGNWIIHHCFELVSQMHEAGMEKINVAINLTAGQFSDANLIPYLTSLLAKFKLPAHYFELEITEQTLVTDIDLAIVKMKKLKTIGFSFAIDDFGTGYSSLAYLKKMPVDVIKIDKSFIDGILENNVDFQIIKSTIEMVNSLGLTVVAEGVETCEQLQTLKELDCDLIQGYFFSKPIPEAQLFETLTQKTCNGYWQTTKE